MKIEIPTKSKIREIMFQEVQPIFKRIRKLEEKVYLLEKENEKLKIQ